MNKNEMEIEIQQNAGRIKKNLNSLVEDSISQVTKGLEKLTSEAKDTLINTSETVKKDIGQGLEQYNAKVNNLSQNIPGEWGKKVTQYPWVAISLSLGVGLLLGGLFKLSQRT